MVWIVQNSRSGLALGAIRQEAEALGVNSTSYKTCAHAVSAALVAVAGSLYAVNSHYIALNSVFAFSMSLRIILMPVIGGGGTTSDPSLAALSAASI